MKKNVSLMIAMILLLSCCQITRMEKRRYFPGYYITTSELVKKVKRPESRNNDARKSVEVIVNEIVNKDLQQTPVMQDFTKTATEVAANETENVYLIPPSVPKIKLHKERYSSENTDNDSRTLSAGKKGDLNKEKVKKSRSRNLTDLFFLLISGLLGVPTVTIAFKRLKEPGKISWWATFNRKKAIGIIALAHLLVVGLGIILGWNLSAMGVNTTEILTNILIGLSALTVLFYPKRKVDHGFFKSSYRKQGLFAMILTILGFLLAGNISNRVINEKETGAVVSPVVYSYNGSDVNSKTGQDTVQSMPLKEKSGPRAEQIILTILMVLLFLIVAFGIAMLTCSLICNGQEVLAIVVAVGGGALAIFLLVITLKAIWNYQP